VDTLEGLEHLAFSGVDLARVLFERCGPAPALPIVITNGLSWPVLSDDASMTLQRGLTQTPQVAMDIRFVAITGGSIMFSVDYASEAVADDLVKAILDRIDMILDHMVETSQYVVQSHKLLPIGRSRVVELVDRDPNESWDIDLTKRKIFDIYCQVIGKEKNNSDSDSLPFSQLGLRPSHLKQISIDLNKELQVDLPVMQLIRCRNADDVKDLALQQVVDF
ncbi:peptide synthetase, partial [Vibrio anguillarum]|nr:peptide synthetase [Vibrio anguillarum]